MTKRNFSVEFEFLSLSFHKALGYSLLVVGSLQRSHLLGQRHVCQAMLGIAVDPGDYAVASARGANGMVRSLHTYGSTAQAGGHCQERGNYEEGVGNTGFLLCRSGS